MREQVERSLNRVNGVRRAQVIDPVRRGDDDPLFDAVEVVGEKLEFGVPHHIWIERKDSRRFWTWLPSGHIVHTTTEVHVPIGRMLHHIDRAKDILEAVY